MNSAQIPKDAEWLAMRVVNPLPSGLPLRFANAPEHQQADGRFRIGKVKSEAEAN